MLPAILFFVFASIAIASAIMMIVHRNPVYCALFLILTMFSLGGHYVLLNAPFIAAIHIIVYAGAIITLFLFVIMLLDITGGNSGEKVKGWSQFVGLLLSGILFVELAVFFKSGFDAPPSSSAAFQGNTEAIGMLLFTKYLFPFEVASVLLLSAIIGSVILAKLKLK